MPHSASRDKGWRPRIRRAEASVARWPVDLGGAQAMQERLRRHVVCRDGYSGSELVAGIDVGYDKGRNAAVAAVVVLSVSEHRLVDSAVACESIRFPYVPGYLSFREIPAAIKAMRGLEVPPDIFLCDGQGIAHPRRLGMASHLGVLLDMPCVGVAKSKLIGIHDPVGEEKGSWEELRHKQEAVGIVLRSRTGVKPIYVSCGHLVGLWSARDIVLRLLGKYRLPETTRQAHALADLKSARKSED